MSRKLGLEQEQTKDNGLRVVFTAAGDSLGLSSDARIFLPDTDIAKNRVRRKVMEKA